VKLAFVTPWYGKDIPGGAEAEVRRTAEHLRAAGFDVEVWTTCVRDFYADWAENYHRPGLDRVNGIPVRRFPVQSRDRLAFDAINFKLMNGRSITAEEERTFIEQMLRVDGLYAYIERHADERCLFFIPYMFSTTCQGIQIRPDRSYLIPCFHNEAYARLGVYHRAFRSIAGMLFLSAPEQALAQRLYDLNGIHTEVLGGGVDLGHTGNAQAFRDKYDLSDPFVLYVGRRDPGKNIELLIQYFRQYRAAGRSDIRLVLIGPGELPMSIGHDEGIVDLGYVPVQDKWDAYAAALVLCQPSTKESFSLVLMEAWSVGTPVLVHAAGAVTADHCRRANGGLYFSNVEEFAVCVDLLNTRSDLRVKMGRQGHEYVAQNFNWDSVIEKYRRLLTCEAEYAARSDC
jgi:glycosyltransferase involved in cell wall biosynthesis